MMLLLVKLNMVREVGFGREHGQRAGCLANDHKYKTDLVQNTPRLHLGEKVELDKKLAYATGGSQRVFRAVVQQERYDRENRFF